MLAQINCIILLLAISDNNYQFFLFPKKKLAQIATCSTIASYYIEDNIFCLSFILVLFDKILKNPVKVDEKKLHSAIQIIVYSTLFYNLNFYVNIVILLLLFDKSQEYIDLFYSFIFSYDNGTLAIIADGIRN